MAKKIIFQTLSMLICFNNLEPVVAMTKCVGGLGRFRIKTQEVVGFR